MRNIGRMIEENETAIRSDLHGSYINKTRQIINSSRLGYGYQNQPSDFKAELHAAILAKGKAQ